MFRLYSSHPLSGNVTTNMKLNTCRGVMGETHRLETDAMQNSKYYKQKPSGAEINERQRSSDKACGEFWLIPWQTRMTYVEGQTCQADLA